MSFNMESILGELPISINNYYGDPVIQWQNTLQKLNHLVEAEHEGIVSIITKGLIGKDKINDVLEVSKNLNIVVLVSISELPQSIDKATHSNRYKTLTNLVNNGIPCIAYVRPFIPPYNTTLGVIRTLFKNIASTGCRDVVISGFRGNDEILSRVDLSDTEKEKYNVRVKIMPKEIDDVGTEELEKTIELREEDGEWKLVELPTLGAFSMN